MEKYNQKKFISFILIAYTIVLIVSCSGCELRTGDIPKDKVAKDNVSDVNNNDSPDYAITISNVTKSSIEIPLLDQVLSMPGIAIVDGAEVFYGKWRFSETMPAYSSPTTFTDDELREQYLNKEITFLSDRIICDGKVFTSPGKAEPIYNITVLPNRKDWYYAEKHSPYYRSPSNEELGIDGPFLIFVTISSDYLYALQKETFSVIDAFYVVDEDHLIGVAGDDYFIKLSRVQNN